MHFHKFRYRINILGLASIFVFTADTAGQSCNTVNPTLKSDIASSCSQMTMSMVRDNRGLPYLYVATKEAGLRIYDISNPASPSLKKALVPLQKFDTLDVMALYQQNNYLYVALGNHFNQTQSSGMAVVKIDTPANAWVTAKWKLPNSKGGAGVIFTEGNYCYLGCMGNGLAVLDISNKTAVNFQSVFVPDINYPVKNPSNPATFNARGMWVKNSIVYLCYDAGGIRIINCSNPAKPKETGRYSNPLLNNKARAYNNCILNDSLLYIGADYCGVEILNVKDTHAIFMQGKWNPYNCPTNNWFTSPVHANELALDKNCNKLFVATGKSDLHVLDVSDPSNPDSCSIYGGVSNNTGTWGVSRYNEQVYLSYVCAVIPFTSTYTGVKILTVTQCSNKKITFSDEGLQVSPNPSDKFFNLQSGAIALQHLRIYNAAGKLVMERNLTGFQQTIQTADLESGIYQLLVQTESGNLMFQKMLIAH